MTESEVVHLFRRFYEGLFPKVCSNCGRRFATLREYIMATQPLWPSVNYDMELGNYEAPRPIGGLAMATCVCGTTLALSSKQMPVPEAHALMEWIRAEAERRSLKTAEMLDHLRSEVRKLVLADPATGDEAGTDKKPPG
jgi:hypothetical protein